MRARAGTAIGIVEIRRGLGKITLAHLRLGQQELAIGGAGASLGDHLLGGRDGGGIVAAGQGGVTLLHGGFWGTRRRGGRDTRRRRGQPARHGAQRARGRALHAGWRGGGGTTAASAAAILHGEGQVADLLVEILGHALLPVGQVLHLPGQRAHLVLQARHPVQQLRGQAAIAARVPAPRTTRGGGTLPWFCCIIWIWFRNSRIWF